MAIGYRPVVRAQAGAYEGAALVGTHSAVIGWTFDDAKLREGLLGFAIRRTDLDPATGEVMRLDWLGGYKRFKETDDGQSDDIRSLDAPFQRFRWNDYTLRAERSYRYEIFPMRGRPGALTREEAPLTFELQPSGEDPGDLGVFVNRGVTAAMAYLARFKNMHPKEVPDGAAYRWLSRGLKESLLGFIAAAVAGEALHVAIYEFFDHEIAKAFKDARDRNVDVQIVYDSTKGKKSTHESETVLRKFGLKRNATPRTTVNISHNKVVIRVVGGVPREVWTGSANFSENAFNYQTNTALIVRDADAVRHFETYFQALKPNPPKAKSKTENRGIVERADAMANRIAERTFFSPLRTLDILEASVDLIGSARSAVFTSAPFGVDNTMIEAFRGNSDNIIEYGLANSTAKKNIKKLRSGNTRFFPPNKMKTYLGRKWDAKAFGAHKIHAKTIVVDPWGDNPKVLIGSANFSKASCRDNDENAMLISGDKRLAAIIATEFMRMYDHYKSRFYIDKFDDENRLIRKKNKARKKQGLDPLPLKQMSKHLKSDESWSKTAFDSTSRSHKFRDRIVFAGG
jgi:phosphatidylserine/phosphatidylglycerophosphate/cardiolipin synthase-like enzyme